MDGAHAFPARIIAWLLVPVALVVLLPFVLLFVVAFYFFVLIQSVRAGLDVLWNPQEDALPHALRSPHFLEISATAERAGSVCDGKRSSESEA